MAMAEARHLEARQRCPGPVRHIDVEDGVGRQRIGHEAAHQFHRHAGGSVEMPRLVAIAHQ